MHCLIHAGHNNLTHFPVKYAEKSVKFQEEEKGKKRKGKKGEL